MLLVVLMLCLTACQTSPEPTTAPVTETQEQEAVPSGLEFIARDLAGDDIAFSSLRGSVVLVNFWASWCPPCQEEMPLLQVYYEKHQAEGFILLGMNVSDQPAAIQDVVDSFGLTFPIWRDPMGDIMSGLNFSGLPTSMVVNQEGEPVFVWLGPFDQASLDEHVTPLLSQP